MTKTYSTRIGGLTYEWAGGQYIEISNNGVVFNLINVWDYRAGKTKVAFSKENFEQLVNEHLNN